MNPIEQAVLEKFKALLQQRVRVHQVILFGSRARGDAHPDSDVDVVVIVDGDCDLDSREYIRYCAWEAGFDECLLVVPVIYTRDAWENSPVRFSLLVQAVKAEGVSV